MCLPLRDTPTFVFDTSDIVRFMAVVILAQLGEQLGWE